MKLTALDPTPLPLDHLTLRGAPAADALLTREGLLDYAGLEHGDRVASWLPKNRLTSLLPLAAARAGLVHVPINPLLKRLQVAHILADSGAALLISGAARLATLEAGDAACPVLDEGEANALFDHREVLGPSRHDPDEL